MTLVVGYAPDARGEAALHLAGMLARSFGDDLVVCSVIPTPWAPGMARVDAEHDAFLDQLADEALEQARAMLAAGIAATFVRHRARSAPAGLLAVADEHDARMIVLGSSSGGPLGHVVLGSVTDRLLHSSHLPVVLAPRGFRSKPDAKVARVTAAYGETAESEDLIVAAAAVAARVGAVLRIASFAVWRHSTHITQPGTDYEDAIHADWQSTIAKIAGAALHDVGALPEAPRALQTAIGRGETWAAAIGDIDWEVGDILVVGSSAGGPVARVFLGSRASKIVRNSPVPVIVIPRRTVAELADRALHG